MKKLSLLVALFMCLTIGGVYATWTYSGTNDITDALTEAKVTIANATQEGSNGVYEIKSNLALVVDQANDAHEAELLFESNDTNTNEIYLTITFTPTAIAPETVKKEGVRSELYYDTTTVMQYGGRDIFVLGPNGEINDGVEIVWEKVNEDPVTHFCEKFTYTFGETELRAMIKLNDNDGTNPFVLDTKAKHDDFRTAMNGNITLKVSDGTVS